MKVSLDLKALIISLFCLHFFAVKTAISQDYERITEVAVFKNGEQLNSPWAGGLNAPQFNEADLNNDGTKDIYIFDRESKRSFTFIYTNSGEYIFEPSFALNFPSINSWVVLADYNCDGIADLITHGTAAPKTYKGFYENNALHFEFDKPTISYEGSSGNPLNLYTVSSHRPLFKDINGDGDRDFLSFDVSLSRMYYYENLRIENNIPCDSIYFDRIDRCYGNFKETGGITLDLILEDTCDLKFSRFVPIEEEIVLHPGGTVIDIYDEGKNGIFDLILGDATFERLNYASNNGNIPTANYYAQDDSFPSYDTPVSMAIFPAPYVFDVDKDGDEDLLVAPFNTGAIENFENVWFYENDGTDGNPFSLKQQDFIVGDMIDVGQFSAPTFFDENNDGLLDIVIGNGGYYLDNGDYLNSLTLFRNTGTEKLPNFTLIDDNYLDLNSLTVNDLAPSFIDIDGDNDKDLICGERKGRLLAMDNNNGTFENPRFLKDVNSEEIDVGQYSSPEIFDFNADGLQDIIIGSRDGNVYYYENTGNAGVNFTFRTDSLGFVTSRLDQALGYSSPTLGDYDGDGKTDLLLGGFNEGIQLYSDIGTDYNASFTLANANFFNETNYSASSLQGIDPRMMTASADISGDGLAEVLLGISNGGLLFYSQDTSIADTTIVSSTAQIVSDLINVFPNPATHTITVNIGNVFEKGNDVELNIYDVMGKLMASEIVNAAESIHQMDVVTFPKGIYILSVRQGNKLGSIRVVKY